MVATMPYWVINIVEVDRISHLKSSGETLEEERCFPGVICDGGDVPIIGQGIKTAGWVGSARAAGR